ncbi:MAG: tetratricopeptide repeat protein, partial [Rubrivivax sp.]|nr:tetratricopeptide repeat protein [Rubrivivax sp.]
MNAPLHPIAWLQMSPPPADPVEDAAWCALLLPVLQAAVDRGARDADAETTARLVAAAHERLAAWPAATASPARIECLLAVTMLHHHAARPDRAVAAARVAVDTARARGERNLLRKSLAFFGVTSLEDGDLLAALDGHSEALALARSLGDAAAKSACWNNLGLALKTAAQYRDAMLCFERAVAVAPRTPEALQPRRAALNNLASCAVHLRDVAGGLSAAWEAIRLNPDPQTAGDCLSRAIAESNHV